MCLAIPMKLVAFIDEETALAEAGSGRQRVNISLLEKARLGDYVIVHAGFAIEKLNVTEAESRIQMFEELARLNTESWEGEA